MISNWTFQFHDISVTSPPSDLLYSTKSGISGYSRKILNFDGINLHCDLTSKAIPSVSTSFEIEDVEKEIDVTDLIDEYVTITIESDETPTKLLYRCWKLKIVSAVYSYGTHKIQCESELGSFEGGKFPPYQLLKAIAPQIEEMPDNLCIPYIIGRAYIPIYPILTQGVRRYLLGKTDDVTGNFTIVKVRSPRDYTSTSYWDDSYTYNQTDRSFFGVNCKITDMIIAPSVAGGEIDSNGIFQVSGKILSPLVQYEGDYESKHPGAFILDVLEKAGITNCNDSSFTSIDSTNFSGVNWAGGFWEYQDLETLCSNLLTQCDCFLTFDDKIDLNLFESSSVETFDKSVIIENSYTISAIKKTDIDGGLVKWRWEGEPEDTLTAEYSIPLSIALQSSLAENPDTEAFEYQYGIDSTSENALKFGLLHFQKKHNKKAQIIFSSTLDKISTRNTIAPGMVIDIDDDNDSALGITAAYDNYKILIYEIKINPDLKIDINGYAYDNLYDFGSITAPIVSPEGESNTDVPVATVDNTGDPVSIECMEFEISDVYGVTQTNSGFFLSKSEAKSSASNLWASIGDSAKWEPWDGASVTTNHTWTGDTGDFSVSGGNLTISVSSGGYKTITISGLSIHAESLRLSTYSTLSGDSVDTYANVILTDDDSNSYIFDFANGSPSEIEDDEVYIGSGAVSIALSEYGLNEIITEITIEVAVDSGDTSLSISISYLDFELNHDMFELCSTCYGDSPEVEAGAYVVSTGTNVYAFYYDECESGGQAASECGCYYNKTTYLDTSYDTEYSGAPGGCDSVSADYEASPWETVLVDTLAAGELPWYTVLLPQETDYVLNVGDMVRVVDISRNASEVALWLAFLDTKCEDQQWGYVGPMETDGGLIEVIWTGEEHGWHQVQYPRLEVDGCNLWTIIFDNTHWASAGTYFTWDGSEWDSTATTCAIYVDAEIDTWYSSYRPSKIRVTFSGGADGGTLLLELVDSNEDTIASQSSPTSPQEMDITFGDYNIERLRFTNYSGSITNIEFLE